MKRARAGDNPNVHDLPQFELIDKLPSYHYRGWDILCLDREIADLAGVKLSRNGQSITRRQATAAHDRKVSILIQLPLWFNNLFPSNGRNRIYAGAVIYGAQTIDPKQVVRGQVECDKPCTTCNISFTQEELKPIIEFGSLARVSRYTSVLRTLLFCAFNIPGAFEGVISPPPGSFKISTTLMNEMIIRSNMLTLNEYKLIAINGPPIEVFELTQYKMPPWRAKCLRAPDDDNDGSLFHRFLSGARLAEINGQATSGTEQ